MEEMWDLDLTVTCAHFGLQNYFNYCSFNSAWILMVYERIYRYP